jgi:hypothetical protein
VAARVDVRAVRQQGVHHFRVVLRGDDGGRVEAEQRRVDDGQKLRRGLEQGSHPARVAGLDGGLELLDLRFGGGGQGVLL